MTPQPPDGLDALQGFIKTMTDAWTTVLAAGQANLNAQATDQAANPFAAASAWMGSNPMGAGNPFGAANPFASAFAANPFATGATTPGAFGWPGFGAGMPQMPQMPQMPSMPDWARMATQGLGSGAAVDAQAFMKPILDVMQGLGSAGGAFAGPFSGPFSGASAGLGGSADWAAPFKQAMGAAMPGMQNPPAWGDLQQLQFDPQAAQRIQADFMRDAAEIWNQGLQAKPVVGDRRFASDAWAKNPVAGFAAQMYLLQTRALMQLADAAQGDAKTRARLRFAVEQWAAASAPSNYMALNADAQAKALQTKGESIAKGVQNLLHDMSQGHVSMTDESQFEVGRNVATTEGAVVFENELFQLLEYKPLTPTVHERPFLMVPPCINKFYILDLQPANSLIRYAVAQGHRTFVVSWRNPDSSLAHVSWDDYIEKGAIRAIEVTREVCGAPQINALGFCVGGTILATALAVLAERAGIEPAVEAPKAKTAAAPAKRAKAATKTVAFDDRMPVASATFLTTLLDFTETGVLDIFIDEAFVKFRETQMGQGGLMPGRDLAMTFSFLRPNDLVWNYVVGNYLKGETPPPFDLLYWNSDATNLPGPMYAWYLRHLYLQNEMVQPGKLKVAGSPIDLRRIRIPSYIYGSREDHIVPIQAAYASTHHLGGPMRFVMGASGHIAGVINPPEAKKRSHWTSDKATFADNLEGWLTTATEHPGSWWTDWAAWLAQHGGARKPAPKRLGGGGHKAAEAAPGRYVAAKA